MFTNINIHGCVDLHCIGNDDENGRKKITMTMILMKRFYVDSLPDEVVGSVHLGFASDNQDGREQWKEALQFPDTPCIKCYPLS